jgi:23S rRNA (pseudouridine1915-N3)-methyltransferase
MKIQIIQVGGVSGSGDFEKRLRGFCDLDVKVLKGVSGGSSGKPREKVIEEDSRGVLGAIEKACCDGAFVVVLDEKGEDMSSVEFSGFLGGLKDEGRSLVFVIGGAFGLSDEVKALGDRRIRLSKMTLTHLMTKELLLEQIYRGFCILNGKEYHY